MTSTCLDPERQPLSCFSYSPLCSRCWRALPIGIQPYLVLPISCLSSLASGAFLPFRLSAFWLMGSLVRNEIWLRRLTFFYLSVAGLLAIIRVMPDTERIREFIATYALQPLLFGYCWLPWPPGSCCSIGRSPLSRDGSCLWSW